MIGFPRGAGKNIPRYVEETEVDAVSLGNEIDRAFARDEIQKLRAGARQCRSAMRCSKAAPRSTAKSTMCWKSSAHGPLIFNLGHGILPQTPIAHVERMLKRVQG